MNTDRSLRLWLADLDSRLGPRPTSDALLCALLSIDPIAMVRASHCVATEAASRQVLDGPSGSRHPNGFTKVLLGRMIHGGAVRLHVWDALVPDSSNDVHGHRGGFASVVLAGELVDDHFEKAASGETYAAFRHSPGADCQAFTGIGTEVLAATSTTPRPAGTTYALTGSELHRTQPRILPTITLVLEGVVLRDYSLVFRGRSDGRPAEDNGEPLSIREVEETLERVASQC